MPGAVQEIITHANFGDDRLRVLAWRWVEFWPFPLTCFAAFKTLSHYRASVWFCFSVTRIKKTCVKAVLFLPVVFYLYIIHDKNDALGNFCQEQFKFLDNFTSMGLIFIQK